jgi:hypothetical protein
MAHFHNHREKSSLMIFFAYKLGLESSLGIRALGRIFILSKSTNNEEAISQTGRKLLVDTYSSNIG